MNLSVEEKIQEDTIITIDFSHFYVLESDKIYSLTKECL